MCNKRREGKKMTYTKQERIEIANNILQAMGTNQAKLSMMIGAKNFALTDNGLSFKFKSSNGMNYIKIELNGKDLYDVEYGSARGTSYKVKNRSEDLYFDMLKNDIEQTIRLYLSLR
jgi:hypothetical protein